jgi:hypothetical protein
MMPTTVNEQIPVPLPAYHREQARLGPALHSDALTLVTALHRLALCRFAVHLAHRRCPPPLPAGPGGAPRTDREESLLLIACCGGSPTRYARLVSGLACFSSGLRLAARSHWPALHSQRHPTVEARFHCWCPRLRDALCAQRADRSPTAADRRTRSDYR